MLTDTHTNPLSAYLLCRSTKCGNFLTQEVHQVAQRSTTTTLSLCLATAAVKASPRTSSTVILAGAGSAPIVDGVPTTRAAKRQNARIAPPGRGKTARYWEYLQQE